MAEAPKQGAKKFLADVPEENVFRCHDSCVMRNMKELGDALKTMTDETYAFHDLQKASNRAQAAKVVGDRVSALSRRLP